MAVNDSGGFQLARSNALRPIYTKCQHQHCDNSAMTLAILVSLKTIESLKNGVVNQF